VEPEAALARAQKGGASYADLRIETTEEQRIRIEDGELESLVAGSETGFGLRVLVDGAWGFASSNALDVASWKEAVDAAVRLARAGAADTHDHTLTLADAPVEKREEVWTPVIDPRGVSVEDKRALLADMDNIVRVHAEIKTVTTAYSDTVLRKEFWNTDGSHIRWGLTRSVAQIQFTARRDGHLAGRSTRVGGTRGWELFAHEDPVAKAAEAAKACVAQLGARSAKGGKTTVVVDPELAGVFAHEAVGHAAEADLVAAGESCFRDRIGKQLGVAGLTIHDDSRVEGAFGSVPYDDNGVRGQDKTILRDGTLVGYLLDRERAATLGMTANGASRAQDFASRPLIRMSNTIIDAGDVPEDELFGGVNEGVFCRGSRGGQVDTARGSFLFNAQDAFRIRNGEIAEPLRDVSLTGDILQTLHTIDALGNEQRLGDPGYCGKGQWVPVCDGGPLVRIRDCLVGGAGG
jgi:TldD protein